MEMLDLIHLASNAGEVLTLLSTYVSSSSEAQLLPAWWLALPVNSSAAVLRRYGELMKIVDLTSRQLDHERCGAAKQALQVFAAGVWKLTGRKITRQQQA